MNNIDAVILGALQGFTEFLPVSSSGHLVIMEHIIDIGKENNLLFTVMLHFGTLLSILLYFRKEIIKIIIGFCKTLFSKTRLKEKLENYYFKLGSLIIIGSVPTALIGILFKDIFENLFTNPLYVGIPLILTGTLLIISSLKMFVDKTKKNISVPKSLLIGLIQGIAITPGISRSGSTISSSILLKIDKKMAADFSFLLSVPAVFGATLLEALEIFKFQSYHIPVVQVAVGTIVSFITGFLALIIVYKFLEKNIFHYFGYYCILLGITIIIYFF